MILLPGINITIFNSNEDDKADEFINRIKVDTKFDTVYFHFQNGIGTLDSVSIDKGESDDKEKQKIYIFDARSKWSDRGLKSNRTDICNQLVKCYNDALRENVILLLVIDAEEEKQIEHYTQPLPYIEYINTKVIYMATCIFVHKNNKYELVKHRYIQSCDYRDFDITEIIEGDYNNENM